MSEAPPPLRSATAIVGAVAVGLLALFLPDAAVVFMLTRGDASADLAALPSTGLPFSLLAMTIVARQLTLLLGSLAVVVLATRGGARALGLRPVGLNVTLVSILGVVGLGPLSDALVQIARYLVPSLEMGVLDQIEGVVRAQPLTVLLPLLALLPALGEEAYFRGLVQRIAGRGPAAIAASALIFALFHIDPIQALGVLPIGLYLAWLRDRTGSLIPPIAAHAANNGIAIVASQVPVAPAVAAGPTPPLVVLGGLGITALVVLAIAMGSPRRLP